MLEDAEQPSLWVAGIRPRHDGLLEQPDPLTERIPERDKPSHEASQLSERMAQAQQFLTTLADDRAAVSEHESHLEQALAESDAELVRVRGQLADSQGELVNLRRLADDDGKAIVRLKKQIDEHAMVIEAQRVQIAELSRHEPRIAKLREQLAALREQGAQSRLDATGRSEEMRRRDGEIQLLRDELTQLRTAASVDEFIALQRREEVLRYGVGQRDKQIAELRRELVESELRHGVQVSSIIEQFTSQQR
jgi:chromosome segregation ATPase